MTHGKNISVKSAKEWIAEFVNTEPPTPQTPKEKIIVGHRFDLSLIRTLITEIDGLIARGINIDSVRIYNAINLRDDGEDAKKKDLIIVPTLSDGSDYHEIFIPLDENGIVSTLIGKSTPCPNVCQRSTLSWPSESI